MDRGCCEEDEPAYSYCSWNTVAMNAALLLRRLRPLSKISDFIFAVLAAQ